MRFRYSQKIHMFPHYSRYCHRRYQRRCFNSFLKNFREGSQARTSASGGSGSDSQSNAFLLPGATVATILMLGALHARRLYEDQKIEEKREKGIELEFKPDVKASFMEILPLRSISRIWGTLTSVEIPVWMRSYVYRSWARAFHSNLEEAALPLEEYASLQEFFIRGLKEGCRPIDPDPHCLVSPVDGTVLRFGELEGAGAMIEQVKGFSYSIPSLLGATTLLPMMAESRDTQSNRDDESTTEDRSKRSRWRISLGSPKVHETVSACPLKGLYYCVLYLRPGDYHRIHSPADWNIFVRRHFSGRLFPVNERAARTIRNLYIENERVVLEGLWQQGFMALAAIGATNIGSIKLFIEPELQTNRSEKRLFPAEPPEECLYEPKGVGVELKKGDELGGFRMGSTVVLIFQAPTPNSIDGSINNSSGDFRFCIKRGDRVKFGQALGRWNHD